MGICDGISMADFKISSQSVSNIAKLEQVKNTKQSRLEADLGKLNRDLKDINQELRAHDEKMLANRTTKIQFKRDFNLNAKSGELGHVDVVSLKYKLEKFDADYKNLEKKQEEITKKIQEVINKIDQVKLEIKELARKQEKYKEIYKNVKGG